MYIKTYLVKMHIKMLSFVMARGVQLPTARRFASTFFKMYIRDSGICTFISAAVNVFIYGSLFLTIPTVRLL